MAIWRLGCGTGRGTPPHPDLAIWRLGCGTGRGTPPQSAPHLRNGGRPGVPAAPPCLQHRPPRWRPYFWALNDTLLTPLGTHSSWLLWGGSRSASFLRGHQNTGLTAARRARAVRMGPPIDQFGTLSIRWASAAKNGAARAIL